MELLIASEALATGQVSRYQLAANYRRLLPDVYAPRHQDVPLCDRITAAWLWSRRRGVITGCSASALHGARWVDPAAPIEMNHEHNKAPAGVITRRDTLLDDEVVRVRGMRVTTVERTAFDLARRGSRSQALQRLDALARATGFNPADVAAILGAHPNVRGRRRVPQMLDLIDAGSQSPKETWLRLLLIDAGFLRPRTQIPILAPDGSARYFLDMGWDECKVAAEYDGEQHRTDTLQYRRDVARSEYIDGIGWRRVRVLAGDRAAEIVRRVEQAGVPRR